MKALEVLMNGHRICLAGIGREGVLSAQVFRVVGRRAEKIHLAVSGMEGSKSVQWAFLDIGVGDEVVIRVVDAPSVDPPAERD